MPEGPNLLQREAIGKMIKHITEKHKKDWGNWLYENLEEWNLIMDSDISQSQYYNTLATIPDFPRRVLCQFIILGWNEHHNLQALYDSIICLIYLKVCGPSEYFFLQQVYNFLAYFRKVCNDDKNIYIEQHDLNRYSIRFCDDDYFKDCDTLALVDINMHHLSTDPGLIIRPWFISFDSLKGLERHTTKNQLTSAYDFVLKEVLPIINNEFAKVHCPWIYTNYELNVEYDTDRYPTFGMAPTINLHNLIYLDNNCR